MERPPIGSLRSVLFAAKRVGWTGVEPATLGMFNLLQARQVATCARSRCLGEVLEEEGGLEDGNAIREVEQVLVTAYENCLL